MFSGKVGADGHPYTADVSEASSDGILHNSCLDVRVTPLDNEHLLVQDGDIVFVIERGDERIIDYNPNKTHYNRYTYRLFREEV